MISPGPSSALQSFWVRANHRTKREQPPNCSQSWVFKVRADLEAGRGARGTQSRPQSALGLHFPEAFAPRTGPLLGEWGFLRRGGGRRRERRAGERGLGPILTKRPGPIRRLSVARWRNGGRERWLCLPSSDAASPAAFEMCLHLGRSTFCSILEGVTP